MILTPLIRMMWIPSSLWKTKWTLQWMILPLCCSMNANSVVYVPPAYKPHVLVTLEVHFSKTQSTMRQSIPTPRLGQPPMSTLKRSASTFLASQPRPLPTPLPPLQEDDRDAPNEFELQNQDLEPQGPPNLETPAYFGNGYATPAASPDPRLWSGLPQQSNPPNRPYQKAHYEGYGNGSQSVYREPQRKTPDIYPSKKVMEQFMGYKLTFGKYKGMTHEQVFHQDYSYFVWLICQAQKGKGRYEVLKWALNPEDKLRAEKSPGYQGNEGPVTVTSSGLTYYQ